ncbi:MAG: pantetheine-phosphate adenylyltransferase [Candidatus Paceibacterota bacterium]|jgi:pantetheine-phosphate adenylyltransferase
MSEKIAIYAGSFDPLTYGHIEIIKRGLRICDKLIIAVAQNISKKCFFSPEERVDIIKRCMPYIEVVISDELLVNLAKKHNATILIRGMRSIADFEFESTMSFINKKLDKDIETIFIMTDPAYSYISSTAAKEIFHFGGSLKDIVPDEVVKMMERKKR